MKKIFSALLFSLVLLSFATTQAIAFGANIGYSFAKPVFETTSSFDSNAPVLQVSSSKLDSDTCISTSLPFSVMAGYRFAGNEISLNIGGLFEESYLVLDNTRSASYTGIGSVEANDRFGFSTVFWDFGAKYTRYLNSADKKYALFNPFISAEAGATLLHSYTLGYATPSFPSSSEGTPSPSYTYNSVTMRDAGISPFAGGTIGFQLAVGSIGVSAGYNVRYSFVPLIPEQPYTLFSYKEPLLPIKTTAFQLQQGISFNMTYYLR